MRIAYRTVVIVLHLAADWTFAVSYTDRVSIVRRGLISVLETRGAQLFHVVAAISVLMLLVSRIEGELNWLRCAVISSACWYSLGLIVTQNATRFGPWGNAQCAVAVIAGILPGGLGFIIGSSLLALRWKRMGVRESAG